MQSNISKKRSARSKKTTKTKKSSKRVHRLRGGAGGNNTKSRVKLPDGSYVNSNNKSTEPRPSRKDVRKSRKGPSIINRW